MARSEFLPYYRPSIGPDEIAAVVECYERGWLTTGPKVRQFEADFAAASGVKHAIALNSCTAGLHLALLAVGVGPGDEVIVPSLSFVAGANCIRQTGARAVFCDVDPDTLCISVETLARVVTDRTKAIMTMDYCGRPAGATAISTFAKARGLAVVEDAALGLGMLDEGVWPGRHADAAVYSFYATKNVTTGEGGMVVTDDDAIMERVRVLALHGMDRDAWKRYTQGGSWRYDVVETGYKYNMPDTAAAIGIVQLRRLEEHQAARDRIAAAFDAGLRDMPGIDPAGRGKMRDGDRHSFCMYVVTVDEDAAGIGRDELIEALKAANIGTSVHYIPSHLFTAYRDERNAALTVTDAVWPRLLSLPLYPGMSERDVADVLDAIAAVVAPSRATA